MTYMRIAAVALGAGLMLVSCGAKPEATIKKECIRLELFADINSSADTKKSCACLAEKLEESMSEKDLVKIAKALKSTKTADDFDKAAEKEELSDMASMNFLGAAKNCALQ
jgi:Mn-dependent DtxR family transcriptional regulator